MIAGTFARLLAAQGESVLALDSDPLPGMAFSAGLGQHESLLPDEVVDERGTDEAEGPRFRLCESPRASAERYAATGPDGLRFLQIAKAGAEGIDVGRTQHAFRLITAGLDDVPWHLVGDLPGGTRQPFFGWARWARLVLVVAEPGSASLLSARRLARLSTVPDAPRVAAVANLVDAPEDTDLMAQRTGLPVIAAIPRDPAVAAAENRGLAPIDHDRHSPAVQAVALLLEKVRELEMGASA